MNDKRKKKNYIGTKAGLTQKTLVKDDDANIVRSEDKTLLDGVPCGGILGLFGSRASGKTILSTQLAFDAIEHLGGNSLSIDTEGSYHTYLSYVERLSDRYDIDVGITDLAYKESYDGVKVIDEADAEHEFCVLDCRDVEGLLSLVGCPLEIEVGKSKIEIAPTDDWNTDFEGSPLGVLMDDRNINYVVLDSISNPMKKFPTSQQNYPSRATAAYNILLGIQEASKRYWIPSISIIHQSNNPTRVWEDPSFVGGSAVGYNTKTLLYISKDRTQRTSKTRNRPSNVAEVWVERAPDRAPWEDTGYVEIELTEEGFRPYNPDDS